MTPRPKKPPRMTAADVAARLDETASPRPPMRPSPPVTVGRTIDTRTRKTIPIGARRRVQLAVIPGALLENTGGGHSITGTAGQVYGF